MAYSNSSLAYDLSVYEAPKQKEKPELKVHKSSRAGAVGFLNMRVIACFAVVVTMLSLMIYNQMQLTEVTEKISRLTTQLGEMESENTRMSSRLEATMSLRSIGEQAINELGMQRLEKYQTTHICLEQEDKIELTENAQSPSVIQRLQTTFYGAITRIQEYIAQD